MRNISSDKLKYLKMAKKYCVKIVYIIHTQQYWPDPKSSVIVFFSADYSSLESA